MRKVGVLIASLLSSSAFALEYPDSSNPAVKSLVTQYINDKPFIDSPNLFEIPNPIPAWPCDVPEVEQYKLANLQMAHPELKADFDKEMRKTFRETGMSTAMIPKTTYSNVQIIPIKAECVDGKISGGLELLIVYDKHDESTLSLPSGEKVIHGNTVANMHAIKHSKLTVINGKISPNAQTYMKITMQTETHYDDTAMEEMMIKNNELLGMNKPTTTRSITYSAVDGTTALFMESNENQVSGGLFGVKVKPVQALTSMITTPIDEHHQRSEWYKNKQLISIQMQKDNKPHGEQITYMDNYLKKLNLRLDQQSNMENAREVTINGVDLIETRTCMQNGIAVKISPCPSE